MKKGDLVNGWLVGRRLGGGGNGDVWSVQREGDAVTYALKSIRDSGRERLARFRSEIEFLARERDRPGILPLVDSDLSPPAGERPWYVMPVAVPMRTALGRDPSAHDVIVALCSVAETLAALAADGVGHRDIKPDNLFKLGDQWVVGDFGLVRYPEKDPVTRHGRKVGPVDYLAPEMRTDADRAETEPADVWSLAKTLWVLLTDTEVPLPGPHRPEDDAYALRGRLVYEWAPELDALLESATRTDPSARVKMAEFARELRACLRTKATAIQVADLAELGRHIGSLTSATHQRSQVTVRLREAANGVSIELREILSDVYHEAGKHLPYFAGGLGSNTDALVGPPPPFTPFASSRWGGQYSFSDDPHRVVVKLGVGLIMLTENAPVELLGALLVKRSFDDRLWHDWFTWTFNESAPVRSAQLANCVSNLRAGFFGNLGEAIRAVASALSEQGTASEGVQLS